jgi:hypothetical protein
MAEDSHASYSHSRTLPTSRRYVEAHQTHLRSIRAALRGLQAGAAYRGGHAYVSTGVVFFT